MVEPPSAQAPQSSPIAADQAAPPANVWERLKRHKVLQWTLAYTAAAYTILHATQMVVESFEWPHLIVRVVTLGLIVALPVVVLLAFYHGHKAQHRFSTAELSMLTVLLIIAGSILWATTRTSVSHTAATGAQAPRTSIAVMPFANMTGDASKEYLGDGIAEEVINTLTGVPGLKVPARTSSFAYKGRNTDIRQIGRDLGVGTILEGSVRSAGERIRITAELINADDGLHIWSKTYNREFTDIFKLEDELATAIVTAMQGTINTSAVASLNQSPPTQDVEAYRDYLHARSVALGGTEDAFRQSLALFDKAISRDPNFARAFAGRAWMRLNFVLQGYPLSNALADAQDDAERALSLKAGLPEAFLALGMLNSLRGAWIEAATNFQAALAGDPNNTDIITTQTVFLQDSVGHHRKSESDLTEAYRLAPASTLVLLDLAVEKDYLGSNADAARFMNLAVALGHDRNTTPAPQVYAHVATRSGHYSEAADRMVEALSPVARVGGGDEVIKLVFAALADPSKKPAAIKALRELVQRTKASSLGIPAGKDLMIFFTELGSLDDAYEAANSLLDIAARSGTVGSAWGPLWLPEMHAFRQDPRFSAFVARLKLPNYWKQYGPPDDCDLHGDVLVCP